MGRGLAFTDNLADRKLPVWDSAWMKVTLKLEFKAMIITSYFIYSPSDLVSFFIFKGISLLPHLDLLFLQLTCGAYIQTTAEYSRDVGTVHLDYKFAKFLKMLPEIL